MRNCVALIAMICFSASCQSKVVKSSGKATRGTSPRYSAELEVTGDEVGQRVQHEMILHAGVRGCLRDALLKSGDDFTVKISGNVDAKGAVSNVVVEHSYDSLRTCLSKEIENVNLGKGGESGPFTMEISRVRVTNEPRKSFLLDLNDEEPKKFQ